MSVNGVSQSVSQFFHGPAPRSPLHRLTVRFRCAIRVGRRARPCVPCVCPRLPGAGAVSFYRNATSAYVMPVNLNAIYRIFAPPGVFLPYFSVREWNLSYT